MNTVNQSKVTNVQQTRELLTALISANYPEVRNLKVKNQGWFYTIRAKYKHRCIRSKAYTPQRAVIYFFNDLYQKVYVSSYIET